MTRLTRMARMTRPGFNAGQYNPFFSKIYTTALFQEISAWIDSITYYHLNRLPSTHHFMATLFNKLIETGTAPACWGLARIKLIYKSGDNSDPSNFRPIISEQFNIF